MSPQDKFTRFHEQNPHVFNKLREIALDARSTGRKHWGIAALFERLRWISEFRTTSDRYRLNNDFRAYYVRLLMQAEPSLRQFFNIRVSAADSMTKAA